MSIFDWLQRNDEGEGTNSAAGRAQAANVDELRMRVIQALRGIYDPEIPVNIYDLGLIYALDVSEDGAVRIRMTLTSANCPVAQEFPETVECTVNSVPGVTEASVELVWEPPWSREMMSETALLELGLL